MIRILRSVGRQLMAENKFSKYLLYAIGEIVLVVVGILIALQINNWNEHRKEQRSQGQLIDVLITDLILKRNECSEDLDYGESIIQKSQTIVNSWETKKTVDTTNLKYVIERLAEDHWFYNEDSPVYAGLSSSDLWKELPDSLARQIDNVYRIELSQIKKSFEKSSEYATHCRLNFLAPNHLLDANMSTQQIAKLLYGKEKEFIIQLELFRSGLSRLNGHFATSRAKIETLIANLESFKKAGQDL